MAKRFETIQNRFLWGDAEDGRKYHLVKRSKVKLPVEKGGLGVRSFSEINLALQGKWIWRHMSDENFLQRMVIAARWGQGESDLIHVELGRCVG